MNWRVASGCIPPSVTHHDYRYIVLRCRTCLYGGYGAHGSYSSLQIFIAELVWPPYRHASTPRPNRWRSKYDCVRHAGEVVQERQPLLSENNKFWAQVEPVARRRSLQSLGPRKYGPKLMSMQSRRRLLHRERMQRAARCTHCLFIPLFGSVFSFLLQGVLFRTSSAYYSSLS